MTLELSHFLAGYFDYIFFIFPKIDGKNMYEWLALIDKLEHVNDIPEPLLHLVKQAHDIYSKYKYTPEYFNEMRKLKL